jgi:hypothetical protein
MPSTGSCPVRSGAWSPRTSDGPPATSRSSAGAPLLLTLRPSFALTAHLSLHRVASPVLPCPVPCVANTRNTQLAPYSLCLPGLRGPQTCSRRSVLSVRTLRRRYGTLVLEVHRSHLEAVRPGLGVLHGAPLGHEPVEAPDAVLRLIRSFWPNASASTGDRASPPPASPPRAGPPGGARPPR